MPEASVHEDDQTVAFQHEIRAAGQGANVKTEAVSLPVDQGSDHAFRARIARADRSHVL